MAEYDHLSDDERKDLADFEFLSLALRKKSSSSSIKSSGCWLLTLTTTILLLLLVAYLSTAIQKSYTQQTQVSTEGECGQSAEEAHKNGCIYSFVPGAWIPRRCHDPELEAKFLRQQEWRWWTDNTTQEELSIDSVRNHRAEAPIYVTMEYHDYHCAYTWLALHRAVIHHTFIDTHIGNFTHTQHCARSMERARGRKQTVATFYPIFASCMDPSGYDAGLALNFGLAA